MGIALRDKGDLDDAIKAYNKALSIKPDYADAYNNMGIALRDHGNLDDAITAYNKALLINPDYADAYNNMGNALNDQGNLDGAITSYDKALSIMPKHNEAYLNKGIALTENGKLDEAIRTFNTALNIWPDYAEAHRSLTLIKNYVPDDPQFVHLEGLLNNGRSSDDARCKINFALAKMYEDIDDRNKAFYYLSEGNALRKKLLNYSIDTDKKLFSLLKITQPSLKKK